MNILSLVKQKTKVLRLENADWYELTKLYVQLIFSKKKTKKRERVEIKECCSV